MRDVEQKKERDKKRRQKKERDKKRDKERRDGVGTTQNTTPEALRK